MTTGPNRRAHDRYAVQMDCKLLRDAVSRYDSALTGDISAGGALLKVRSARPIRVGEQLEIAVNWSGRPLLTSEELRAARVVRVGPVMDATQSVAIRFDAPQHEADALTASTPAKTAA